MREQRELLSVTMMLRHVPWDESERHKLPSPKNSSKIKPGFLGQSIPSRRAFLDALTKPVWKISPVVGGLIVGKVDCAFYRIGLILSVIVGRFPK